MPGFFCTLFCLHCSRAQAPVQKCHPDGRWMFVWSCWSSPAGSHSGHAAWRLDVSSQATLARPTIRGVQGHWAYWLHAGLRGSRSVAQLVQPGWTRGLYCLLHESVLPSQTAVWVWWPRSCPYCQCSSMPDIHTYVTGDLHLTKELTVGLDTIEKGEQCQMEEVGKEGRE